MKSCIARQSETGGITLRDQDLNQQGPGTCIVGFGATYGKQNCLFLMSWGAAINLWYLGKKFHQAFKKSQAFDIYKVMT